MKWLSLAALALSAGANAQIFSGFDAGPEDWTVIDYPGFGNYTGGTGNSVAWSPTGGNPDGHIRSGDPSNGSFFFLAPSAYYGDRSTYYGGTISFYTQSDLANFFDDDVVILKGGGLTIVSQVGVPGTSWTFKSATLAAGLWTIDNKAGALATETQILAVLGNMTELALPGECINGLIEETKVDNVSLAPVPEPASLAVLGLGLAVLSRKRRA